MSKVVLMGAPGAGKSAVGRRLGESLHVPFYDVDSLIEDEAGKPVAEIFADDGEAAFRAMEERVTISALERDGIISLGGGAVLNEAIREALLGHTVVWLQVSITHAARRVGMNRARPLLLGNVRGRLIELLRHRTPLYDQCATMRINTDELSIDQVVAAIEMGLADEG